MIKTIQGKEGFNMINLISLFCNKFNQSSGGNYFTILAQLFFKPVYQCFYLPNKTKDYSGLHTHYGIFPDSPFRSVQFNPGQFCSIPEEGFCGNPQSGSNSSSDILSLFGYSTKGGCCSEINNDHRASVFLIGSNSIHYSICTNFPRIIH